MKRATGWVGVVLGLALGCGRARPHVAMDGVVVPEGPDPSHRWLALAQPHGVTLVGFDNPAAPTQKTLVDFADDSLDSITSATFNRDGTRLAYSYRRATGEYGAGVVTTPAGAALGTTWSFPGREEPQLAWVGNTAIVARGGAGESSHLLRLGESDARNIGLLWALQFSADHATLMAHSEGRLQSQERGSMSMAVVPSRKGRRPPTSKPTASRDRNVRHGAPPFLGADRQHMRETHHDRKTDGSETEGAYEAAYNERSDSFHGSMTLPIDQLCCPWIPGVH